MHYSFALLVNYNVMFDYFKNLEKGSLCHPKLMCLDDVSCEIIQHKCNPTDSVGHGTKACYISE